MYLFIKSAFKGCFINLDLIVYKSWIEFNNIKVIKIEQKKTNNARSFLSHKLPVYHVI